MVIYTTDNLHFFQSRGEVKKSQYVKPKSFNLVKSHMDSKIVHITNTAESEVQFLRLLQLISICII